MMGMRMRWVLGALMFLAGMINYLDRSALGVAAPLIRQDLHLDPAQLGIVFSSFSFGYALFCFVGGYASDRFGPRNVLGVSMVVWSIFCGLTAIAWGVTSLLVLRILFGMGEGRSARHSTRPSATGFRMASRPARSASPTPARHWAPPSPVRSSDCSR